MYYNFFSTVVPWWKRSSSESWILLFSSGESSKEFSASSPNSFLSVLVTVSPGSTMPWFDVKKDKRFPNYDRILVFEHSTVLQILYDFDVNSKTCQFFLDNEVYVSGQALAPGIQIILCKNCVVWVPDFDVFATYPCETSDVFSTFNIIYRAARLILAKCDFVKLGHRLV